MLRPSQFVNRYFSFVLGFLFVIFSQSSQAICWFNCKKKSDNAPSKVLHINVELSLEQQELQKKALATLQSEIVVKFGAIESLLGSGRPEQALSLAKEILDTVRVKTGIDPKKRIVESFLVPMTFPSKYFSDFNNQESELVIRTIGEFRGGLYMDIMNLSKRTSLIYVKAFKAVVDSKGGKVNF